MINYYSKFEEILKNKEKYAEQFNEGNKDLYKLLLELWNRNIETVGCCTGHNKTQAYIAFSLENDYNKILNLLSSIPKEKIRIGFVKQETRGKSGCVGIHTLDKEYNKTFFKEIIEILDKKEKDDFLEKVMNYIIKLKIGEDYINIRIFYKNKTRKIRIVTTSPDKILILPKDAKLKYYTKGSFTIAQSEILDDILI